MALLARRTAAKDTVAADVAGSILAVAAEEDENAFDSFDSPCVPLSLIHISEPTRPY